MSRAEQGLFVVCDGMGGAPAGEVASEMAIQAIARELTSREEGDGLDSSPFLPHTRRLVDAVQSFGERLRDDPTLQARVDGWIASTAVEVVERSKGEVGEVIASTVARWDASDATERIELQVGRDLQFIRINGTVVGGLVGLVIYSVGQLLG